MKRTSPMLGALLVLGTSALMAQEPSGTIRGTVMDAGSRQPLARVTVTYGARGAVSQDDGTYVITGARVGTDSLRARLVGYAPMARSVSVMANQTTTADFAMNAQAVNLSEIVVTGYGEQRAGDITGAVSTVSDSEFNPGQIVSPAMLIQNKVAGVQVVENNDPGGGMSLRIRGTTSIAASSEPLYVVDGLPVGTGAGGGLSAGRDPLNFINPNDIENITVLRDASASAIYGSNAANGVVIITTRGASQRSGTQFEYSGTFGASQVTRTPDLMNASEFAAAITAKAPKYVDSLLGQSTNWYNEIDRTAFSQQHDFSISNAGTSTSYRLSAGYLNQDGIIDASNVERFSLGLNLDQRLFSDRLMIRANLHGARSNDQFTPGDVLGNAAAMAPTQPVLDSTRTTGYWDWNTTQASPSNPVASMRLASDKGTTWRAMGNVTGEYKFKFAEGLSLNANLGYDLVNADRTTFFPNNLAGQIKQGQGFLFLANNSTANGVLETYLNYRPTTGFGPGQLDVTGGYSYTSQHSEFPSLTERGLQSNLIGEEGIPPALNVSNVKSVVDYRLISFFGRANYNIRDRYLIAASLRRDGSSRFGPGRQWGTFPSISGAWRLSQEGMFRNMHSLSELKLRASWAATGNQAFGDYQQYPTYTYSDGLTQVQFGNGFVSTIRPTAVDTNIHWEQTDAYNIGLDWGFNNQRWNGTIDFYVRNTSDLLFNVPIAAGTNLSNFVTTNIGSMKNSGIELALNGRVLQGGGKKIGYNMSFTVAHNHNELESIDPRAGTSQILTGGISGGVGSMIQILRPGLPVNSFFVYQHRSNPDGTPVANVADTLMYVDQNGDHVINSDDKIAFHSPNPDWIIGHSSYFTMGKFDASFTLRAYLGNYAYNNVSSALGHYQNITGSAMPANLHRSVMTTQFDTPQYFSDYYVENASFLRMDNLSFGYNFSYHAKPMRVYATMQNVFTITGYSGVDPTSGLNGIDNNIYPRSRTFSSGISVRL